MIITKLKKGHESLGRPEYSKDTYGYLDQDEFRAKYISIVSDKLNEYEFKFFVEGVHCVACLWLLEKINEIIPGVISSKLNMATSVLNIKLESETKLGDVARQIASLGYRPHPILQDSDKESYAKKEDPPRFSSNWYCFCRCRKYHAVFLSRLYRG